MDSANNSSSLQSSSGNGNGNGNGNTNAPDVDDFDSHTFFTPTSTTFNINSTSTSTAMNINQSYFDSLPFLDSPSFPLLSSNSTGTSTHLPPTKNPLHATNKPTKKRSRASRRAPTTVLTTDTSNFRAMVQEFTGVPSPPFSTSTASSLLKPYPHKFLHNTLFNQARPSSATAFTYQHPPSTNSFRSLLQSQLAQNNIGTHPSTSTPFTMPIAAASASAADHYGALAGAVIGPGWGQDAGTDPTRLGCNAENKGGEGMVESWICSSD